MQNVQNIYVKLGLRMRKLRSLRMGIDKSLGNHGSSETKAVLWTTGLICFLAQLLHIYKRLKVGIAFFRLIEREH